MSCDDGSNSGGCLSGLITLFLLPYIIIFYGYALLLLLALMIFEWIKENIGIILLYTAPVIILFLLIRLGVPRVAYRTIKRMVSKPPKMIELEGRLESPFTPSVDSPSPFTPSSNLYCYWCTKKLGLQAFQLKSHYYCQSCFEKVQKNKKLIQ